MPHRPRRAALLVAGTAALCIIGTPAAPALAATPLQVGLFGSQDPTYDGVYRQGLSIIALEAAGVTPDAAAIDWLAKQECADGSFNAFRADTATPCAAGSSDSNATAMAVQALASLGKPTTVEEKALRGFQLPDGGYYANTAFGAPSSDANSTGLAMSALTASGDDPDAAASSGKTPVEWLLADQLGCDAQAGQGAFDFQPESPLAANDYATVQAALGIAGGALPVQPRSQQADAPLPCPSSSAWTAAQSASAAAAYLAARLQANNGVIPSSFGSGTDWTTTANAVLDLVQTGVGGTVTAQTVCQLASNVDTYVREDNGADAAGPLATLILVAHATGKDPRDFSAATACPAAPRATPKASGVDLVARLLALETKAPAATPTPTATPVSTPAPSLHVATITRPKPTSAAEATGTLPRTGDDSGWLAGIGGLCLALGAVLVLVAAVGGRRKAPGGAGR